MLAKITVRQMVFWSGVVSAVGLVGLVRGSRLLEAAVRRDAVEQLVSGVSRHLGLLGVGVVRGRRVRLGRRVGDLDRSIAFYTDVMGMKVLRRNDNEEYQYTLAFVGYQDESDGAVLELTYNWGTSEYDLGTAYGHIALEVENAAEACERIRNAGGNVTREAGPVKGGKTVIAFVEDPDGYKIELIEKKPLGPIEL
mgnify:CR=1 FL=1